MEQGLYTTIDELRGLTGDDVEWDSENNHFEGFGKSKDLPIYLQWVGEVRNFVSKWMNFVFKMMIFLYFK